MCFFWGVFGWRVLCGFHGNRSARERQRDREKERKIIRNDYEHGTKQSQYLQFIVCHFQNSLQKIHNILAMYGNSINNTQQIQLLVLWHFAAKMFRTGTVAQPSSRLHAFMCAVSVYLCLYIFTDNTTPTFTIVASQCCRRPGAKCRLAFRSAMHAAHAARERCDAMRCACVTGIGEGAVHERRSEMKKEQRCCDGTMV